MATQQELADFLQSVEKRAFKRSVYQVRDEDAALDIVQDSMMKLSLHYANKPVQELPLLFQRILQNTILDWFRRQKTYKAVFSSMSEFERMGEEGGEFDVLNTVDASDTATSAEEQLSSEQTLKIIDEALQLLPTRQREAFLLRYWEDMSVAETASIMGCAEGSVKIHCFRAVAALSKLLAKSGIGFEPRARVEMSRENKGQV